MGFLLDAVYSATLLPHYLYHRVVTQKYGAAAPEKLAVFRNGHDTSVVPDRPRWWLHAVSVGETLAARPLVKAFAARHDAWELTVSTTTPTGREVAQKHYGADRVIYYPLDFRCVVERSLARVDPRLVVLMELEVWPHFLAEARRRAIPVVVANVRITERSVRGFSRVRSWSAQMLQQVDLWLSQSDAYAERLRQLGVAEDRIQVVGSIKYDGLDFAAPGGECALLQQALGGGRLWVAGSTHPGEEEVVYAAFGALRREFPDLRLVLVPRHPERCDEVARLCPGDFSLSRRSAGPADPASDVVLVDTMGELARLYRAAEVVFVGGSLLEKVGGHNMLEPAAAARPVVYGPCVSNFAEPAAHLEAADGAVRFAAASAPALAAAVAPLLADVPAARAMGRRACAAAQAMQGATARSLEAIDALLEVYRP